MIGRRKPDSNRNLQKSQRYTKTRVSKSGIICVLCCVMPVVFGRELFQKTARPSCYEFKCSVSAAYQTGKSEHPKVSARASFQNRGRGKEESRVAARQLETPATANVFSDICLLILPCPKQIRQQLKKTRCLTCTHLQVSGAA